MKHILGATYYVMEIGVLAATIAMPYKGIQSIRPKINQQRKIYWLSPSGELQVTGVNRIVEKDKPSNTISVSQILIWDIKHLIHGQTEHHFWVGSIATPIVCDKP